MELKHMQAQGLTHLTLTELHTCQAYYQRLHFAVLNMSDHASDPRLKTWSTHFLTTARKLLTIKWLGRELEHKQRSTTKSTVLEAQEFSKYLFKTLEGLIALELIPEQERAQCYASTLNTLYQCAHEYHNAINVIMGQRLDIQTPRVLMMDEMETPEKNENEELATIIPLYQTHHTHLESVSLEQKTSIQSIEIQRQKRFDRLIEQAHALIGQKETSAAKQVLEKALNYQETAEAFNLLSWCYSLEGELETAKTLCLKAIKNDPAHGAAYNDLGSYLLSEGQINESLKWFEMAKNARQYQNREFAFINAGRAYVEKRDFKRALKEFSLALTLAPDNEELHKTVNHLKETLNRSRIKEDHTPSDPVF